MVSFLKTNAPIDYRKKYGRGNTWERKETKQTENPKTI